jgi:hypothetical protein
MNLGETIDAVLAEKKAAADAERARADAVTRELDEKLNAAVKVMESEVLPELRDCLATVEIKKTHGSIDSIEDAESRVIEVVFRVSEHPIKHGPRGARDVMGLRYKIWNGSIIQDIQVAGWGEDKKALNPPELNRALVNDAVKKYVQRQLSK